jgi:transmembrane sensor
MNKKNSHIDEYLLVRYLDGQATAYEASKVADWLASDVSNLKIMEQYQKIWSIAPQVDPDFSFETDNTAAWESIAQKTGIQLVEDQPKLKKTIKLYPILVRLAAVFVLGVGIALMYFWLQFSQGLEMYTSNQTLMLSDSSHITLHQGSVIRYPEQFTKGQRRISMQGKAFFEITPNPHQPFVVEVQYLEVEVVGTSFFIDALSEDMSISIGVETGEVIVRSLQNDSFIYLHAGEEVIYDKNVMRFSLKKNFDSNNLYWKTQLLEFRGASLREVFNTLSYIFDYQIILHNHNWDDCLFSGRIAASGIDDVLQQLVMIYDISYVKNEGVITIDGSGCPE